MNRIILSDSTLDGPTWLFASHVFQIKWKTPGGDWIDDGGVAYIRVDIPNHGARTLELDATNLVRDWLKHGNAGLHLRRTRGPDSQIAGRAHETEPIPSLEVDGKFCPCIASIRIHNSAGNPMKAANLHPTALMRFDLEGMAAVTKAILKLRVTNVYAGALPVTYEINRLDMPALVTDPAREIGGVLPRGRLAALISRDDLSTDEQIMQNFLVTTPISVGGWERTADGWLRCWGGLAPRIVSWWKVFQPRKSGQSWRRPYLFPESQGYDELFMQYRLRIGADVRDAFNELGMKLPGFEGAYNLSNSGERTMPLPLDRLWSARLWHSPPSDQHPHMYRAAIYWYGEDLPAGRYGEVRYFNRVNFYFQAEREYTLEQQVKMNTLNADGSANADGIVRVWINGVLCHEETHILIRKHPSRQVQTGFVNIYHGGMKSPKGRMHYDLANICFSTAYIGVEAKRPSQFPKADSMMERFEIVTLGGRLKTTLSEVTAELPPQPLDRVLSKWSEWTPVGDWSEYVDGVRSKIERRTRTVVEGLATDRVPRGLIVETKTVTQAVGAALPPLPPYVPPVGTFAEFTTNRPRDAGAAAQASVLANWCGGAFIRDYSAHGGVAYCGGGEHFATPELGGVLVLNIAERKYELPCLLPEPPRSAPIWTGAAGSGATVKGNVVQLPSVNLSIVKVNQDKLFLQQATNATGKTFLITAFDDAADTVTVNTAPTGVTSSVWRLSIYIGPATDIYGGMDPDGYPSRKHTYNCIQEMPSAWGGGPRGSLARVAHSGGQTDATYGVANGLHGLASTWKYDLSQAIGGVTRITGTKTYRYDAAQLVDARTNDAPNTGIDYQRQGWWSKPRIMTGTDTRGMCFTSKDGQITRYPTPHQETAWAQIHHFDDDDLLCIIGGYDNTTAKHVGIFVTIPPDKPGTGWVKVKQVGMEAAIAPTALPADQGSAVGYMGMRWCSHPKYQCFIGFPNWASLRIDDTHIKILLLTPPPVGSRKTGIWQWSSEVVASHDGSIMRVGVTNPDHAIQNGAFGKLVYCEPLRSLVWTRRIDQRGQLIRLARMG